MFENRQPIREKDEQTVQEKTQMDLKNNGDWLMIMRHISGEGNRQREANKTK